MSEPVIQFEKVSKGYEGVGVLKDFSLEVEGGEFITLIGRSGCGKTTAMKLVNGLLSPDTGRVLVRGEDVAGADQIRLRRSIGYAIQGVGLFPHMTVARNIAYVPSLSSAWRGQDIQGRVAGLLGRVGLDPGLAGRYPRELSGGQRQRVGIARALASSPDILLMDEPFGAVDGITRSQLQEELMRIHRESKITVLFVTHDISEAVRLGTRMLVMDEGRALQCGAPEEVLRHPANGFVERLVASCASRGMGLSKEAADLRLEGGRDIGPPVGA